MSPLLYATKGRDTSGPQRAWNFGNRRKANLSTQLKSCDGQNRENHLEFSYFWWKELRKTGLRKKQRKLVLAHVTATSPDTCMRLWEQFDSSLTWCHQDPPQLYSLPTGSVLKPHVVPRWLEPFQASYPHMSTAGGEQTKLPLQMSQHIIQVPRDLPHWELTTMAKGMGESEWLNPPNQMTGKGKRRKGGFSRGL